MSTPENNQSPFIGRLFESIQRRSSMLLDKSAPHTAIRWIFFFLLTLLYWLRVWYLQGFYIVTYGLGIYLLNLFIGFLQPQDDLSSSDGATLPVNESDEFRPFRRRVPEFRFWWSASKAVMISIIMTFFAIFDIPVFWPILLLYFMILFTVTMKKQIKHMIKYRYIPVTIGKPRYDQKSDINKKKPAGPMPKVRPPIRSMPQSHKKLSKD